MDDFEDIGQIHWLDEEETEFLKKEFPEKHRTPKYLLPERSKIEEKINDLYHRYYVPVAQEKNLDDLVFKYAHAVAAVEKSYGRWEKERGNGNFDVWPLLYLEFPEVIALTECVEELKEASTNLGIFLNTLKVLGNPHIPEWMKSWYQPQTQHKIDERYPI